MKKVLGKRQQKTRLHKISHRRKRAEVLLNKDEKDFDQLLLNWGRPGKHIIDGILNTPDVCRPVETLTQFMNRVRISLKKRDK